MGDRVPGTDPASRYVTYAAPAEKGPLVERCSDNVITPEGELERHCSEAHQPRVYHLVAVDLRTGEVAHPGDVRGQVHLGRLGSPAGEHPR